MNKQVVGIQADMMEKASCLTEAARSRLSLSNCCQSELLGAGAGSCQGNMQGRKHLAINPFDHVFQHLRQDGNDKYNSSEHMRSNLCLNSPISPSLSASSRPCPCLAMTKAPQLPTCKKAQQIFRIAELFLQCLGSMKQAAKYVTYLVTAYKMRRTSATSSFCSRLCWSLSLLLETINFRDNQAWLAT